MNHNIDTILLVLLHNTTHRKIIAGSFEAYYQLTDNEIKHEIAEHYVPKGYCSVSDFEWNEIKL